MRFKKYGYTKHIANIYIYLVRCKYKTNKRASTRFAWRVKTLICIVNK